ncbi:MAG: FAD-dependent monooxygenase [Methyloceanibacter sp.]|uniref:FAD-dependent monooxygenase n=1 Tax=Methyloceanibacter sp. TaxID=1965321 RepID=UPI003D6CE71F
MKTVGIPHDLIIAGGGFVGGILALTLAKLAPTGLRVALVDGAAGKSGVPAPKDPRGLALSAASKSVLEAVGLWSLLAPHAEPIRAIEITDSPLHADLRPHFLGFDEEMRSGEPRAYLVEAGDLLRVVSDAVAGDTSIETIPDSANDYETDAFCVRAKFLSGGTLEGRLLVAADGKRSRLRDGAGIKCVGWSYPQVGIVTTVVHERPHHGRAMQHFLPAGPFAILPLRGNRCSIVWTEEKERGRALMEASEEEFTAELSRRFGHRLGAISLEGPRQSFPLEFQIARSFIADRLVLIGDAAHVVHPLAGQGLNIGLRDVAALAETIVETVRLGLDIGASPTLERYQRWRRFDSAFSATVMDGLNQLFSNDNRPLRAIRDLGLGLVDRTPPLKRFLVSEAAGSTGAVPRLLKGEAL